MIKGKWKLLICTILVTCVLFIASNSVFAAINETYYTDHVQDYTVADSDLDSLIKNDLLIEALGRIIFNVGRLLEYVLGQFFILITGSDVFPWADAILFNAIPFLDINVFNPSGASLLAIVQEFISGTYYTVLTLASSFFGIAVMVSAVKLVLTAIAEDKARYKKAIVDWLLGLVMLWGIHFFISFVLYLNEELVQVASNMMSQTVAGASEEIVKLADSSENNATLVGNFVEVMSDGSWTIRNWVTLGAIIIGTIVAVVLFITGVGAILEGWAAVTLLGSAVVEATSLATLCANLAYLLPAIGAGLASVAGIAGATGTVALGVADAINIAPQLLTLDKQIIDLYEKELNELPDKDEITKRLYKGEWEYEYTDAQGRTQTRSGRVVDVAAALLKNSEYREYRFPGGIVEDGGFWQWNDTTDPQYIKILYLDAMMVCGMEFELTNSDNNSDKGKIVPIELYRATYTTLSKVPVAERDEEHFDEDIYKFSKALCEVQDMYVRKEASQTNVVTNLATYFKQTAYTTSATGWVANKSVIQNALMYAILVAQSLIFFIAYTKRLFYVIMLILMAPVVVVMDFFTKFSK